MDFEREETLMRLIANISFVIACCFVTYFCYLFGLNYETKIAGVPLPTFVFSSTLGASCAAMAIAMFLKRRFGGREVVEQVVPGRWINRSGDSTAGIVVISGGTYVLPFMAVAVGAAVLKVLALLTSPGAEELLEKNKECERDPIQKRTDLLALVLGTTALALIAVGQFKKRGGEAPVWLLIIIGFAIIVYCAAYLQRQYVMGGLRARVGKVLKSIKSDEEKFTYAMKMWMCFYSAEQARCFKRIMTVAPIVYLVFHQYIGFHPLSFAIGIFFGVMSFFAVMIMVMNYGRKDNSSHAFSMVFRFVVHKLPSMLAGIGATMGVFMGWHDKVHTLAMPSTLEWSGVVVAFAAVLLPLWLGSYLKKQAEAAKKALNEANMDCTADPAAAQ